MLIDVSHLQISYNWYSYFWKLHDEIAYPPIPSPRGIWMWLYLWYLSALSRDYSF